VWREKIVFVALKSCLINFKKEKEKKTGQLGVLQPVFLPFQVSFRKKPEGYGKTESIIIYTTLDI